MNFELTDDQRALAAGVRDLCAGTYSIERVQELEATGEHDTKGWASLQAAGVFSLRVAESRGGVGLGMADAAVVFTELGRALVPGPVLGTHLAAGLVEADAVGVVVPAQRPMLLAHPDVVEQVVVVSEDGLSLVPRAALEVTPVAAPLDPLTPLATVGVVPEGDLIGGPAEAQRFGREGAVLAAALLLGIAESLSVRATAYAKEREQFGRPIGGFQAVKHLLADMVVRTEVARAAVYAAAVHLDDPDTGDVDRAVSSAKLLAGEAGLGNGKSAVQIHGGMGFTWELPVHLYLKRAAFLDVAFGNVDHHAQVMAELL